MFRTCSKICHICLTLTTSLLVHKLFMPCWQLVHDFSLIFHDLVMNFSWVVTCKWLVRNLFINLFMTCFKLVHASWLVHALFKKLFPISSGVLVLDSFPICSWLLKDVGLFQHNLFKPCSWLVYLGTTSSWLLTICSWLVHDLFRTTFLQLYHNLFMTCSFRKYFFMTAHYLFMTCSRHVQYLFRTCSRLVQDLFITCSWQVRNLRNWSS